MKNWEKMFMSLRKGAHSETSATTSHPPLETHPEMRPSLTLSIEQENSPMHRLIEEMRPQFNELWANILLESGHKIDLLMFCGSAPGEGCSFVSFHLSLFLATVQSMKTLYVDTTIDEPHHKPLVPGMADCPGLASFISGNEQLGSLVAATDYANLFILPSGAHQTGQSLHRNIIEGHVVEELVEYCRNNFDITIFDGQPIATRPVTIEFAKRIKNVIMVCRYGQSRREVSMISIEKLRKNNIPVTGVVLNDRQYPVPRSFYKIMR